jgi:hypothetical protein
VADRLGSEADGSSSADLEMPSRSATAEMAASACKSRARKEETERRAGVQLGNALSQRKFAFSCRSLLVRYSSGSSSADLEMPSRSATAEMAASACKSRARKRDQRTLNRKSASDPAVKVALAEAHTLAETKRYFESVSR